MSDRASRFICFTGIDGSGKTSLCMAVLEELESRGVRVKYVYGRYVPALTKPLVSLSEFIADNHDEEKSLRDLSGGRRVRRQYPRLFYLYLLLALIDYLLAVFFRIERPLRKGYTLVCDRYVWDTVISDFAIGFNLSHHQIETLFERFARLFPTPDVVFLIDVPEEVALRRKNDIPCREYLSEWKKIFDSYCLEPSMITLNGEREIAELEKTVMDTIGNQGSAASSQHTIVESQ